MAPCVHVRPMFDILSAAKLETWTQSSWRHRSRYLGTKLVCMLGCEVFSTSFMKLDFWSA
jgi:hypothetical protein